MTAELAAFVADARTARLVARSALGAYRLAERERTPAAVLGAVEACEQAARSWALADDEVAAARWQASADMWRATLTQDN